MGTLTRGTLRRATHHHKEHTHLPQGRILLLHQGHTHLHLGHTHHNMGTLSQVATHRKVDILLQATQAHLTRVMGAAMAGATWGWGQF